MTYPVRSHSGIISRVTTNCEKSAEVIVAERIFREGLNNSKRQVEMYVTTMKSDRSEIEAYLRGNFTT